MQETMRTVVDEGNIWRAYVDGSTTKEGAGVGIFIQNPERNELRFAIKFNFSTSNNEAKYEALIRAMKILIDLQVSNVIIFCDSQLVTQHVLGTYDKKEKMMIPYLCLRSQEPLEAILEF